MSNKPHLSIIIASYNSIETIETCLDSLRRQSIQKNCEIIMVDSSSDGTGNLVKAKYPEVILKVFPSRKFPGEARNIAISTAQGAIIAFLDADCQAEQNWATMILKAHESNYRAIGGAVANANPQSYVGWAAYFTELSNWMVGLKLKKMSDIGTGLMSYKREVFEKFGVFKEGIYSSDTDFHFRLRKSGHDLCFNPSIIVAHHNISNLLHLLSHEFFHGKSYAAIRLKHEDFSIARRGLYICLWPLISLKLLFNIMRNLKECGHHKARFVKVLPLLLLSLTSWSLGEATGYLQQKQISSKN